MDQSLDIAQSGILEDDFSDDENFTLHISIDEEDGILENDKSDILIVKENNDPKMSENDNTGVRKLSVDQKNGPKDLTLNESPKKVSKTDSLAKTVPIVRNSLKRKSATSKKNSKKTVLKSADTETRKIKYKLRSKVGRPKILLKSIVQKFKLQVVRSSAAVHETEGNEKVNTTQVKISKKSFKIKSPKSASSVMAGNKGDENMQHQRDGQNILKEFNKPQESEKAPTTATSSNKKSDRGEQNEESATNSKARLLNKMRKNNFRKKLSYENLKELCLQKVCNVVVCKSDIGKLQDQLKIQQRASNKLSLEVDKLSKQAKDLKIMNEFILRKLDSSDTTGPIIPSRVTRSASQQGGSYACKKK